MSKAKPFCISKQEVWEAYKRVKANKGAAGVDEQSIAGFEKRLKRNLYKIASSGKSVGDGERQRAVAVRNRRNFLQVESKDLC